MIQIYNPENVNFSRNGDMTLFPTKCTVHAVLNKQWELQLEHPIDTEGRWKYITDYAVLKVPSFNGQQLFRIQSKRKTETGVHATAAPIFMDAAGDCFLVDVRPTGKNGQEALNLMCAPNSKYIGTSDITRARTSYYQAKNLIEAINGEDENSFVNRWGGEILFNNFQIIINDRVGGDYGVQILYGKNIQKDGISEEIDMDVVTRIVPKSYNGYMLSGNSPWVNSPIISSYPVVYTKVIKYEDVKLRADANEEDEADGITVLNTMAELRQELIRRCNQEFENGIDRPKATISVNLVMLQNTVEYKDYQVLEKVSLGDTVHAKHSRLGIVTDARVIELKYDSIRKKVTSVVIGDFAYNYFDNISSVLDRVDKVVRPDGSLMAEKVQGILNGIYTQLRLQSTVAKKVNGRAFEVSDTDPDSELYGCMIWGTQGLQIAVERTPDGLDWNWRTAITAKGVVADAIITGILSDRLGKNYWNLDTGEFRLSAEAFTVDDETVQDYVDGKIDAKIAQMRTLTVQLSNDNETIATDSEGNNGNYSFCFTDVQAFIGSTDITNSPQTTFAINAAAGVTGIWDPNNFRYSVSYLTEDNGFVDISVTYANLTTTKRFSFSKNKQGLQGEDGVVYSLQATTLVIKQGANGVYSPRNVTYTSNRRIGSAEQTFYPGRFEILESTDGANYTRKYVSASDEVAHTHTPSSVAVKNIRCILYAAGGTTQTLDIQGTAVVRDIDNLSQMEVFNILTNNGTTQGIYMSDGKLYLNATYMATGILADKAGKNTINMTTGSASLNGSILTDNGTRQTKVTGGGLQLYYKNRLCGGINPCRYNNNDGILGVDLGTNGKAITLSTGLGVHIMANHGFNPDGVTDMILMLGSVFIRGYTTIKNSLKVTGVKSRVATTKNYDTRLLYCYEMPSPIFGDIGEGVTDSSGSCYIMLDDIFQETINTECSYQVFLQKEGNGDLWISEKTDSYFIVQGTPGIKFSWEVKAKQKGYEYERLDSDNVVEETDIDYEGNANRMVEEYYRGLEDAFYV